jgi:thymidylate synthase (FAD)
VKLLLGEETRTKLVLDKGYVKLVDHVGTDARIVNAARVSFEKEIEEMSTSDARLIHYLVKNGHWSPFRHCMLTFSIRAPLMVTRQHWKYIVGSDHTMDSWNEASRRYVTEKEEFYLPKPDEWRSAPESKKQGSGELVSLELGSEVFQMLMEDQERQLAHYHWALDTGVCAEQARLFLPAYGLYVSYYWTASLQSVIHFLSQRLEEDAQVEIQEYARAIKALASPLFRIVFEALRM